MEFKSTLDKKDVERMEESFDSIFEDGSDIAIGDIGNDDIDETTPMDDKNADGKTVGEEMASKSDKHAFKLPNMFGSHPKTFNDKTLEEKMTDIYEEYKADTTITLSNIRDIAFRTAAIKGRWCSRLMAERVRYRRLKEALDVLVEEIGKMVDDKARTSSYLSTKMNRDKFINDNEEVKRLRKEMYESKQLQDYYTFIYECIGDLGYVVKNSLSVLELERGI